MPSLIKKVFFANFAFEVLKHVYEPAEDSFLFADKLQIKDDSWVLDVGTGCGILAVVSAKKGANTVATDINPHAVQCAKKNAELNDVANRVFVLQGYLFSPIRRGANFDVILFNAPYLPSEDAARESWIEWAWAGGPSGRNVIDKFISETQKYLKSNGEILLMQSTLSNVKETLDRFRQKSLKAKIIAEQDLPFFEKIVLIRACQISHLDLSHPNGRQI